MKCPDCDKVLIDVATSCRCGWVKSGNSARPHIQCDEGPECTDGAICMIDGRRLCLEHYNAHFTRKARQNTADEDRGSFKDKWAAW